MYNYKIPNIRWKLKDEPKRRDRAQQILGPVRILPFSHVRSSIQSLFSVALQPLVFRKFSVGLQTLKPDKHSTFLTVLGHQSSLSESPTKVKASTPRLFRNLSLRTNISEGFDLGYWLVDLVRSFPEWTLYHFSILMEISVARKIQLVIL